MPSLEDKLRILAKSRGVDDQEARDVASEFASKIRSLARPEPDPDILIREVGNDIEIVLPEQNEQHARDILEQHIDHGDYELDHTHKFEGQIAHCFTKVKKKEEKSSSSSSSTKSKEDQTLEERFREMSEEEREIAMAKLLDQFDEG